MVAKLENQRRILSNRLRKVSSDISHINATRPELGGMYLNQLQPERVQLIRWHDDCVAALEEAKEYTQEEITRSGKLGVRKGREIDSSRPHTSPFSQTADRFYQAVGELKKKRTFVIILAFKVNVFVSWLHFGMSAQIAQVRLDQENIAHLAGQMLHVLGRSNFFSFWEVRHWLFPIHS